MKSPQKASQYDLENKTWKLDVITLLPVSKWTIYPSMVELSHPCYSVQSESACATVSSNEKTNVMFEGWNYKVICFKVLICDLS